MIQKLVLLLRLRACASLALGQAEPGPRDILLGFRLRAAIGQEPVIIANLVDVTCCGLLMQPVLEGLAARRWSGAQLRQLQAALSEEDLLWNYRQTREAQRAFIILPLTEELRGATDLNNVRTLISMGAEKQRWPRWLSVLYWLSPRGWFDEGNAVASILDLRYSIDPIDAVHQHVDARKIEKGNSLVHNLPVKPTTFVAAACLAVRCTVDVKIACCQAIIDQADVACALERFYLDHQSYPADLDALIPGYLSSVPTDVIGGGSLRYQPTPDGRYRLWEVGWNNRDENGKIAWQKDTSRPDYEQGDWVWQYAPTQSQPVTPESKATL